MSLQTEFRPIELSDLHHEAAVMKTDGYRFMQTHAVNTDEGVDLYYSFMKDGRAINLKVQGVTEGQAVPSITDLFLAAFVFENEARELFGVDMRDIAIDFAGAMYAPAESEPMTYLSPEQKAARDKARKALAAKAQKPQAASDAQAGQKAKGGFVMTPERRARLDAKLATMSPDKVAKVEAALKAREAEAQQTDAAPAKEGVASKDASGSPRAEAKPESPESPKLVAAEPVDTELESKIALLDAEKAAKVRRAIEARKGESPASAQEAAPGAAVSPDHDVEAKLALMSDEKASKVRAALAAKAARDAASKGGE